MSDKIKTLHPDPKKQGVNIDRQKYEQVRRAILAEIDTRDIVAFSDLPTALNRRLPDFAGSISWYAITVKLDLEARQLIERVPGKKPQHLRRKTLRSTEQLTRPHFDQNKFV
jgi:hypothetical protein